MVRASSRSHNKAQVKDYLLADVPTVGTNSRGKPLHTKNGKNFVFLQWCIAK
jgi:hypothetical protein